MHFLLLIFNALCILTHSKRVFVIGAHGSYIGATEESRIKWPYETHVYFIQKPNERLDGGLANDFQKALETKGMAAFGGLKDGVADTAIKDKPVPDYFFGHGTEFHLISGIFELFLEDHKPSAPYLKVKQEPIMKSFLIMPAREKVYKLTDFVKTINEKDEKGNYPLVIWNACTKYIEPSRATRLSFGPISDFFPIPDVIQYRTAFNEQYQNELREEKIKTNAHIQAWIGWVERYYKTDVKAEKGYMLARKNEILGWIRSKAPEEKVPDLYHVANALHSERKKTNRIREYVTWHFEYTYYKSRVHGAVIHSLSLELPELFPIIPPTPPVDFAHQEIGKYYNYMEDEEQRLINLERVKYNKKHKSHHYYHGK